MTVKTILLGATAALALCGAAQAGHHNGWYIGIEGGANWIDDTDGFSSFDPAGPPLPTTITGTTEFDTGWAVLGTFGYAFSNNWRLEAEVGYRSNEDVGSDFPEWSLMANVLYDIHLTPKLDLSLGAGAGYDVAEFNFGPLSETDGNLALQGIAGLSYAVSSKTDLTLTYRYLHVSEPEFVFTDPVGVLTFGFDDVVKHTVTLGLRYSFGHEEAAAPPPPAPMPPPPPPLVSKSFVIFFGFGKCNITAEADQVLSEAAAAAKNGGAATVRIVGHTDSVGSSKANQRLSECRADAAKTNLVGKGIAEGSITASGKGEGELMIQTGDNVKESQNRRATVDLN